ncbi:hypothetical protein TL16_g04547 [Triparma laevis f. inornata]|uniref:Uncharacterized protein n=1 Tax=Triparma laevis f. inornata TaxID=1714386 RepID=A0A9W7ACK1_9STRA|nr:hypothetical protein TL16_g04547 [Triparma laevis f. inornata]
MYGGWDVVSLLLERGADVTLRNEKNVGPLTHSCLSGNTDSVSKILSNSGSESCFTEEGKVYSSTLDQNLILSPLKASVISGEIDVIKLLLNRNYKEKQTQALSQPQDYKFMDLQQITLQDLCCYLSLPKVYSALPANFNNIDFSFKYAVNNVHDHDDVKCLEMLKLLLSKSEENNKNIQIFKVVEKTNGLHDLARFGMVQSLDFVLSLLPKGCAIDHLCTSKSWTPLMHFLTCKKFKPFHHPIIFDAVKKFKGLGSKFCFEDKHNRSLTTLTKRNAKNLGKDVVEFVDNEAAISNEGEGESEIRLPGAVC